LTRMAWIMAESSFYYNNTGTNLMEYLLSSIIMKKIISSLFTVLFASCCFFYGKKYAFFLEKYVPFYVCAAAFVLVFCLVYRLWVTLILCAEMKDYRMGELKLKLIWVLAGLLMPAIIVVFFYIFGTQRVVLQFFTTKKFIESFLFLCLSFPIVEELTLRALIFQSFENVFNRTVAVVVPSVVYSVITTFSFTDSFHPILYTIIPALLFAVLMSLISWHCDDVYSAIFVHISALITKLMFDYSDSAPLWEITLVESVVYALFIVIAIILVHRKHNQEVLYW